MDEKMIFIVGVGRSGTTLLQSMLNAHRDIAFTPETHFIKNYLSKGSMVRSNEIDKKINKIKVDKNVSRTDLNIEKLIKKNCLDNAFSVIGFYRSLLNEYKNKNNKSIIGDKDPKNIEHLDIIKKFFPNAYVIHIIRDPRDVVLSRLKSDWSKNRGVLLHSLTYENQIMKGKKIGKELFGNRYCEVKYENLILEPEENLQEISSFLGVNYDENMINYTTKSKEIVKEDEQSWKGNAFKPVIRGNFNKWQKKLKSSQISTIQSVCKKSMKKNGYQMLKLKKTLINKLLINFAEIPFNPLYNIYLTLKRKI